VFRVHYNDSSENRDVGDHYAAEAGARGVFTFSSREGACVRLPPGTETTDVYTTVEDAAYNLIRLQRIFVAHIALVCPPFSGHLNPMTALGCALQQRGHRVTVLGVADVRTKVQAEGLEFYPIGHSDFPLGSMAEVIAQLGALHGLAGVRYELADIQRRTIMLCRDAPAALRAIQADGVVVDQIELSGATIAESLGLPFVTVYNALMIDRDPWVPPVYTLWPYRTTRSAQLRNRLGAALGLYITRPVRSTLNAYRRQWHLPPVRSDADFLSPLAQISQLPAAFDFPRRSLPPYYHYTGPFLARARPSIPFPWDRLTGQPLVYASLGTLQNRARAVFHAMAAACAGLDVQLVLTLGGGGKVSDYHDLLGSPLVVEYAPQLELLARARLTITHAGLNTVLESLSYGVPLVAIPITNDQPGVGSRLAWSGAGRVVPLARLDASRLRIAVRSVLANPNYHRQAARLRDAIQGSGGAPHAAAIVEQAVLTHTSVPNTTT